MNLAQDKVGNVVLKAPWNEPSKGEPAWFGAVQLKKYYVSCHLMPLYASRALREQVPPELQRRMQGKSCFNFKKVDPDLFDKLERLIAKCASAYAVPAVAKPHEE
jgi:hypothetical protein